MLLLLKIVLMNTVRILKQKSFNTIVIYSVCYLYYKCENVLLQSYLCILYIIIFHHDLYSFQDQKKTRYKLTHASKTTANELVFLKNYVFD